MGVSNIFKSLSRAFVNGRPEMSEAPCLPETEAGQMQRGCF